MKVKIQYQKGADEIIVSVVVVDRGDYPTEYVFFDPDEGRGCAFVRESFSLSLDGLQEAREWVRNTLAPIRERVRFWRNFELPPEEVIEI